MDTSTSDGQGVLKPRRFGVGEGETSSLTQANYDDKVMAKDYPTLYEFLTREWWEPKKPREKGTLIIFYEEGMCKCCVSDKDAEAVAFVSKKGLSELLKAVEKGLKEDTLDWRLTRAGKQKTRK